ncbi:MAG TPA: GGDEF domain-containing protein [Thermoleophilaceae bacterium]
MSLGDAVRSLLTLLEQELPGGRVVFGELNYNTDEYRVLDALGAGVDALSSGVRLPLRESFCIHMASGNAPALTGKASKDPVYSDLELRQSAGIESYVAAPVELADGTRVASVSAMSPKRDLYGDNDIDLLTVAARLLAYEWEHVTREGELRRLAQFQRDATSDPLTGLLLRDPFLEQLDREWHLTERGITESYLLALQPLGVEAARVTSGDPVADLLLKHCAEVISAAVRRSDIAARVASDVFGVILVGCKGIEGAEAFRSRLESSFGRVMSQRPEQVQLITGIEKLGEAESPAEALQRAEEALGAEPVGAAG